jgi:hypothetical protein
MTSQTCRRVDLAREQLEMALDAFQEHHRFASAITLASAANDALRNPGEEVAKHPDRADRSSQTPRSFDVRQSRSFLGA